LVPMAIIRHACDERTGQVAVIWKPVSTRAVSIVSQPVVRSTRREALRSEELSEESSAPCRPWLSIRSSPSSSCLKA
jgi:hypothetical protein